MRGIVVGLLVIVAGIGVLHQARHEYRSAPAVERVFGVVVVIIGIISVGVGLATL